MHRSHITPDGRLTIGKHRRRWAPYLVPQSKFWFSPRHAITNVSGKASAWGQRWDPLGAFTAFQSDANARPTIATGINGRESLAFASANSQDLLNTTDDLVTAGDPRYVLLVAKSATVGGGTLFAFRINQTGGRQWVLQVLDFGVGLVYFADSISNSVLDGDYATKPDFTQPFIIEYELTAGSAPVIRVNGATRPVSGTLHSDPEAGTTGFRIASRDAGSQTWNGDLADIYCASPIPSAADKAKLLAHFALINGLPL
jgi:hypothetical protein